MSLFLIEERVEKVLKEEKTAVYDILLSGNVVDFQEYKRLCGVLEGITRAERVFEEVVTLLKNN